MIWIAKQPGKVEEQISVKLNFKRVAKKQAGMYLARKKPDRELVGCAKRNN